MPSFRNARLATQSMSRRGFLGGAAATTVGTAAVLAGCGGGSSTSSTVTASASSSGSPTAPKKGGTLRLPIIAPDASSNFDIQKFAGDGLIDVWAACANLLVKTHPKTGAIVGDLAASWSFPDPLTMVVKLKPGAKWQNIAPVNGRAVTAADVKFSFERIATNDPSFVRHSDYSLVERFEAPDDQTFRVILKAPYVPLLAAMANQQAVMVAPEVITKFKDLSTSASIIGSGPFILDHADTTQGGLAKRNPDYWEQGGGPYLDAVQWTVVNDPQTLLSAFLSSKFDIYDVDAINLSQVKAMSGVHVIHYVSPSPSLQGLGGPIDVAPLNDMRVRQAINLTIDRLALGQVVFPGVTVQPAGVIATPAWGIPAEELLTMPGFRQPKDADIANAKKLVDAAGGNIALTITTTSQYPSFYLDRAQVYKAELEQVGFKVTLDTSDYTTYKDKEAHKRFQLDTLSPYFTTDPDSLLSAGFGTGGARNYLSYSSAAFDDYVSKERTEADPDKRKAIVLDAQRLLLKDLPMAFANFYSYSDVAVRDNVMGVQFGGTAVSGSQAGDQASQAKDIWLAS